MQDTTHSAATQAAQFTPGEKYLPLAEVTRPNLKTEEAAFYLNRRPQTLRAWAMKDGIDGLRPKRIAGLLAWPTNQVKALALGQSGFADALMLAAIAGLAMLVQAFAPGLFDLTSFAMLGATGVIGVSRPTPTERQFNFEYFADAAREQGQEANVIVRNGQAIFTLTDHGQTIELTAAEAAQYVLKHEENAAREFEKHQKDKTRHGSDEFGLCPVCSNDPEILNVGREHFAICREHKVYWHVGSNLFSGWREEAPESWEQNKKLLATYTLASEVREAAMCNGPSNIEPNSESDIEHMRKVDATRRPPLGTMGDCLAETASYQPAGYTRITGCTESFWRDIPADKPDTPWFVMDAVTASLEPAPVTIYIESGTTAATAREILKQAAKWLKEHGDELHELTPQEPAPTAGDGDSVPF